MTSYTFKSFQIQKKHFRLFYFLLKVRDRCFSFLWKPATSIEKSCTKSGGLLLKSYWFLYIAITRINDENKRNDWCNSQIHEIELNRKVQYSRSSVLMFTFRCLSNRFLTRTLFSYRCRQLSLGVTNPQTNNEQCQSTLSLIKEDLQLIHRDILQVSKYRSTYSFLFF